MCKTIICIALPTATAILAIIFYYYNFSFPNYFTISKKGIKLLTVDELSQYNGVNKEQLYLAIMGIVFDVSKGSKHYGPGQSYNIFVGRDASRSFINGEFDVKKVSEDVIGLTNRELRSLNDWVKFYKKEYKKVGKLIGRYYDENGKLTTYGKEVKSLIKIAQRAQRDEEMLERQFPPCNVEWQPDTGSRVWCTTKSGGIERTWTGVPRQLFEPGSDSYRCACVNAENLQLANIKQYANCDVDSTSCYFIS